MRVAYQSRSTVVGSSTLAEGDVPSRLGNFPVHRSVNTFRIYHGERRRARHLVHELYACRIGHDEWGRMDRLRRKQLVGTGWKLGTGDQFLGLSRMESGLVSTQLEDGAPGASLDLYLRALFSVHPPAEGDIANLARRWAGATAPAARRATRRAGTGSRRRGRP